MGSQLGTALKSFYRSFSPARRVIAGYAAVEKSLYTRGLLSAGRLNLPDFLGIGAPRAGTTWLDRNLRAHPDLCLPDQKELHYFDRYYETALYIYTRRFRSGRGKIKGEITPAYSILPVERIRFIRTLMPDARLFFILRHPIERSWSETVYNLRRHIEDEHLKDVSNDFILQLITSPETTSRSDYLHNIDHWLSVYPPEQLLIVFYESIDREPQRLLTAIFNHIGARTDIDWETMPYREKYNVNPTIDLPADIRATLEERYCPEIEALHERFGAPVAGWRC
jgi:hypothetical protein